MKIYSSLIVVATSFAVSNADICISYQGGNPPTNQIFYGNYKQGTGTDGNGEIYYVKEQTFEEEQECQTPNNIEYLYLRSASWQTSFTLNGASGYIRCSSESSQPDGCPAGNWESGSSSNPDTNILVSTTSCSPQQPVIPTIDCSSISIEETDTNINSQCVGRFSKVNGEDSLFTNDCSGYYFYYNQYFKRYECGTNDERDYCEAFDNDNPQYGISSTDSQIGQLSEGQTDVTVSLLYPSGATIKISCGAPPVVIPTINCNYIELANTGNSNANGLYAAVAGKTNLFQNSETLRYFQYNPQTKEYLVANVDVTDECESVSYTYFLKSQDSTIGTLSMGDTDVSIQLTYPASVTATISCLAATTTPAPIDVDSGSLCIAIPEWINGGGYNWKISGIYKLTGERLNDYVVYQRDGCDSTRYLYYYLSSNPRYDKRYIISNSLSGSIQIYFYCTASRTDPLQCTWNYNDYIEVSDASTRNGGCNCNSEPLGSAAMEPVGMIELSDSVIRDTPKSTGIWAQFLDFINSEIASMVMLIIFIFCVSWSFGLCVIGCFKRNNSGKKPQLNGYQKAKVTVVDK